MSNSDVFERFLDENLEIATGVVVVTLVWIVSMKVFGGRSLVRQFPRATAFAALIVVPIAVIVLGGVARVLLDKSGIVGLDDEIRVIANLAAYLVIAWCLARIVELWILSRSKSEQPTALPGLQRSLLFVIAIVLGLFAFISFEGYSITGLFISTGAVAAVVAFAMQRTLGDLFSGIALSIERPFRVGDWIALGDGSVGQVTDINWRATRLRGWDNATYVIPNGELARQTFKNLHGSDHFFAPWYEIKIPAEVDPRFAKALLLEAALRCDRVLKQPLPLVRLMDASTVPYTYMIWVHFANYPAMFAGREQLYREIHYAMNRAGIQTSAEIREIHARKADTRRVELPTTLLALKALDISGSLTEEELQKVASMSERLIFDAGTVLLREGTIAYAFDVIVSGIVESSIDLGKGARKSVERLSPGQYFGITSMMTTDPSVLQFTALTDVSLIRVDTMCVKSILGERPDLAERFAKIVKQRLDRAEEARLGVQKTSEKLTFSEILRRIELAFWQPGRR